MREHQLLVRHATAWAESRSMTLHPELLEEVLDRRARRGRRSVLYWPRRSGGDLARAAWPEPASVPEVERRRMVGTMRTFWQFLARTGRLAPRSATPDDLAGEMWGVARREDSRVAREESARVLAEMMERIERVHRAHHGAEGQGTSSSGETSRVDVP